MADVRLTATNPEDSSVVPVACDAAGRLLLEEPQVIEGPPGPPGEQGPPGQNGDPFSGNFAGDVTFGGSATFAGGKSIIGNDGSAQFAQGAVDIYAGGRVEFTQNVNIDGSIDVKNSGVFTMPSHSYGGTLKTVVGGQFLNVNGGTETGVIRGELNGVITSVIHDDGSAEFADKVFAGKKVLDGESVILGLDARANVGAGIHTYSAIYARNHTATGRLWFGASAASGTTATSEIFEDGSVTFAGNKAGFTAEGYLWCTTERGDTVYLQGTSQGVGIWADYTPNTRLEEIRDKLDANRGDTGEMPADTQ